mmetsp:Transcript_21972/g.38690  ORF Transcript_21972/g.38690 Transcript_21972/m.38690 type:complete len:375 (+) Transcript_21972:2-1126(+)
MEKALIRRIQKLEKSAESLEEQADMVRRDLKSLRRKFLDKSEPKRKEAPIVFLPDAEVFEQQQMECRSLHPKMVKTAQHRVFNTVKSSQPTLTQMLSKGKGEDETGNSNTVVNEDAEVLQTEYQEPIVENGQDDVDDQQFEYIPEREYNDKVTRIHRNIEEVGNNVQTENEFSLWDSMVQMTQYSGRETTTVSTGSNWDKIFADKLVSDEEEGLEDLLHLFQVNVSGLTQSNEENNCESNEDSGCESSIPMLSQRAQAVAQDIVSNASARKDMLDVACPNWKENIAFALRQQDSSQIQEALRNVRESRNRMENTKKAILGAWERQDVALELFETALLASANRLKSENPRPMDEAEEKLVGGFLTQDNQVEDDEF